MVRARAHRRRQREFVKKIFKGFPTYFVVGNPLALFVAQIHRIWLRELN